MVENGALENGNLSVFSSNANRPSDFRCELSKDGPWHAYVLLRAEAWSSHTLKSDEKKCGIRSVITKTETRGPYTRPFTVYFVHTKTAFSVKGVCKRFSDFKELDQKIKKNFKSFNAQFPPDKVFNSMAPEFVSERRKQLQTYLDDAMAVPEIAAFRELHDFLGIPTYLKELEEEQADQAQKERKRTAKPEDDRPETYLRMIERAKLDGSRQQEAQAFNALGLLYCESGLEAQGVECLESSLELCRANSDKEGMIVVLSNLGCLHNLLELQQPAIQYFQECYDLLEGDPEGQAEAQMKLSLTCAANGDNYEAIEHCLQCLKLNRQNNDHQSEASCLFTLGSIYYEAGEVRQAVEAFEQCLVLRRKNRDKIGLAEALNKLGLTYCDIGYDLRAMDYFEQSLVICEDNADLHGQAVCLQHLGNVFKMQKDNPLAIDFFQRCLAARQKVGDLRGTADCHDSLGLVYFDILDIKTALEHYQASLEIRTSLGDVAAESECYKSLGTAYMYLHDTQRAVAAFQRCLDIQRQLSNSAGEVDALISLGLAHFKASNNQAAVTFLEEALALFQHLPPEDASAHSGKAVCLDHLGNVYGRIGRSDKAVTYYTMSLRVKKDIGDMTGEARCLVRIGLEFLTLNELQRAFEAFTEALHMFERLEDDNGISICYENLGDTYMKMGEIRQAIFSYDRCLPIKVETWDKVGEAECLDNLGLAHYCLGELRLSAEYYEQSLAIWKAEGDKHALMTCYESLGGVDFQLGEHMRSIECYVQHLTLSQDIGDGAADHEILLRLGLSNAAIGEYQVALQFLQQALSFYTELNDNRNRALCLQHIGAVQGKTGEFDLGMKSLEASLKLRTEGQDKLGIADCFQEMGLLCYNEQDYHRARGFFGQAQRLLTETNDKGSIATCTMHIGATYAAQGELREAIQQFKTALMVDVRDANWAGKVDCLNHLGVAQTKQGDHSALQTFQLAANIMRDRGDRAGEAALLMQLAQANCVLNQLPQSLENLQQCLELRKSLNDKRGQADALMKISYLQTSLRSFSRAKDVLREATELRAELGDDMGLAECNNARALLLVQEGKVNEGISAQTESLKRLRDLNDTSGLGEVLNNISVCYSYAGDYPNAIKNAEESVKLFNHNLEKKKETKAMLNLGHNYVELNKQDTAAQIFEKAIVLCRGQADVRDEAACYGNLGTIDLNNGDAERATISYNLALNLLREHGEKRGEAQVLHNMGVLHLAKSETAQAVRLFEEALQLFRASRDGRGATNCLLCLKEAHTRLGDAFKASQMIHLLQEYYPEEEVWFLVRQLESDLEQARASGDRKSEAEAHVAVGDAVAELDVSAANQHYQKALKLRESLGGQDARGEAECYGKLAGLMAVQGELGGALETYKKGSAVLGDVWREGSEETVLTGSDLMYGLGCAYLETNHYEEAVKVLSRCLQLRRECGDEAGEYETSNKLAIAYMRAGDVYKATEALKTGVGGEFVSEVEHPGQVTGTGSLVCTLMNVQRHEDALRSIALHESNLALHKARGNERGEGQCYWALGVAYASIDQLQQAADSFSICYQLRLVSGDSANLAPSLRRKGLAMFNCGNIRSATEDLEGYVNLMNQHEHQQLPRTPDNTIAHHVEALCALGKSYHRVGDVNSAADTLKTALNMAHSHVDRVSEARCLMAFATLYQDLWITKRSLDHYQKALEVYFELGDKDGETRCIMEMGRLQFIRGDTPTAIKSLEEALNLAHKSAQGSTQADCLMAVGEVHYTQGDYKQTQAHYQKACQVCKEQLDPFGEATGLCGLSKASLGLGLPHQAIDQVSEALKIRKSLGDRKAEAECLRLLADLNAAVGRLGEARQHCEAGRQLSSENSEILDRAKAEVIMGRILAKSGDVDGAIAQLQAARDLHAQTTMMGGVKIFLDPHELGECLYELAAVYMTAGERSRAIGCVQQVEKIFFASEDAGGLAKARCKLAVLLSSTGSDGKPTKEEMEESTAKLRESMEARKKHGNRAGVAECVLSQGVIFVLQGQNQNGSDKLKQARDIYNELDDQRGYAQALMELGHATSTTQQGEVYFQEAIKVYHEINDQVEEGRALQHLGQLQTNLNNRATVNKTWYDCLAIKREIGDTFGVKKCLGALISLADQSGDSVSVMALSKELYELAKQGEDADNASHALHHIGKVQAQQGNPTGAIDSLNRVIQLCATAPKSTKALARTAASYDLLASIYNEAGRVEEAEAAAQEAAAARARGGLAQPSQSKISGGPAPGAPPAPQDYHQEQQQQVDPNSVRRPSKTSSIKGMLGWGSKNKN